MTLEPSLTATVTGETVTFEFRVENAGESPVELTFSSGQTADVAVYEGTTITAEDEPVWRWSDGMMFTQALQTRTLPPGDTITEEFTWETESGGEYTARGTLTADREMTAETTISV